MEYLEFARDASNVGYPVTFLGITVLAVIAAVLVAWLVRAPVPAAPAQESLPSAGG